ncbi:MAG: DUF3313 domain-containing protein [Gammaproteobacteria bacterium]
MKSYKSALTIFATAVFIALTGCASKPTEHYSGFLSDYSQLKPAKDAKGEPIMAWVSPDMTSGKYHKVIIDPVVFYPAAAPTKEVDAATLNQIQAYYTNELRQKIGAQIPVVDQPGPDVLRLEVAITAVATENAPLKAYDYIPIAFVVHTGMSAAGKGAQDAEIGTEMEVLDSQSGTRLAAVVKSGRGTEVTEMKQGDEKGQEMVTLDNVKPLLDSWAETAADFAAKNLSH